MSPGGPITWKAWVPRLCAMYQLSPHPGHKPPSRRGLNTLGLRQNTRGPSTRLGITIRTLQLRGPEATAPAPTWLLSPQVSPRPLLRGELGKAGNQPDTRGEDPNPHSRDAAAPPPASPLSVRPQTAPCPTPASVSASVQWVLGQLIPKSFMYLGTSPCVGSTISLLPHPPRPARGQAQVWVTATPRANPLTSARPGKTPTPPPSGPPAPSCHVTRSETRAASLREGVREDLTAAWLDGAGVPGWGAPNVGSASRPRRVIPARTDGAQGPRAEEIPGKGKGRVGSTTGSSRSERGWDEGRRGERGAGVGARGAGALRGRPRSPDQDPLCPAEPSARSAAAAKFFQLCPLRSEGARGRGARGAGGAGCGGAGPAAPPPRAAGLPRPQARPRPRADSGCAGSALTCSPGRRSGAVPAAAAVLQALTSLRGLKFLPSFAHRSARRPAPRARAGAPEPARRLCAPHPASARPRPLFLRDPAGSVPTPPGPSPQAPAAPSPLPVPRPPLIPGLSTPGTLSAPRQQLAPLGRRRSARTCGVGAKLPPLPTQQASDVLSQSWGTREQAGWGEGSPPASEPPPLQLQLGLGRASPGTPVTPGRGAGSEARTSVNDPTPRSTPPDPPPAPERVRGGHGCGSSLTEAGRPLERGAEALEGVGVPELTEGAGPEARPGDKDPQAAWGLDAADGEKKQVPRVLRPPNPLKLGPECWVQPAARRDHRTPPAAQMGRGDGPASVGREGIPARRRQSGPGTARPASGEGSVEDGASIAPVWAATGHTVQFGKKVGGDTQRPESQEGGPSRGRGGNSGGVSSLRARAGVPPHPGPGFRAERLGQRRLGIAWSWVPRGRAAAAGGARRPGGMGFLTVPDGGRSPHELGAPRIPLLPRKQDHPVTPSLPIPPFLLTMLRKSFGSPRRLLARGVRSPGPSGRGVGEGSLSGRGPATANFGCDRLGTREQGGEDRRKQRSITKPHWRETRPRRRRSGQGAGTGAARAARASGDPAHAPTAARESLFPASPRGGELLALQPREKGPPNRSPAQPPPPPSPSYLLSVVGPGLEAPSQESATRAPRSPERGGGGGAPCLPLPEPAGLGSACDGERSGAGGSRAAALTASSAGRARGGDGGDSARRARGRPDRRGSGGSGSGSSGSGAGAVVAAAAAPRL
ncbi:collagen alpha-1(I) chain-like [Cervus canadensis]|uniref:collagen alpha-1(I) chain-like n=1 Tax=Cervus canadensis TaxID=1574408 RepID=UPI001CA35E29|nr:collagen alpha-1(I) chain-like [Cervus canadensis]